MPYGYVADDEFAEVVDYSSNKEEVSSGEVDLSELKEAAVSVQRLAVNRTLRKHVKGSMEIASPGPFKNKTPEKMFHVNKLLEWTDGNPDVVVAALSAGRLRCRLSARMGLGKSTKLASYIAKAMDYRVLHVALDAHALQQVGVYIHNAGIGKFSRAWSTNPKSSVSCMTYNDFNGYMATARRAELFKAFDVLIFDEAFVDSADVFVAKRNFSVYAPANTNLLVCSATIRSDQQGEDSGSASLGSFKQIDRVVMPAEGIASGKLFSSYLVDRTAVFVPDNESVYQLHQAYADCGVDVKMLDDASDYEALRDIETWFDGDSTTPRVVVAHMSYSIAFNFAIEYAIIFPYESALKVEGDTVSMEWVPMSEAKVTQAKSRTGRGIVAGSGGVVMSNERSDDVELCEADKVLAFVKMCACSIMPIRNNFWARPYDLFPEGLSSNLAHILLKVCLPPEITMRYLANDARVSKKYCAALNAFAQPDHFLLASDKEEPVGLEYWVKEDLVCLPGEMHEEVVVPFHATGELQVIMHSIEMMAQNRIQIPRWRPTRLFALSDGYDSEEEEKDPRHGKRPAITLRRIEDRPLPSIQHVKQVADVPWRYRPLEGSEGLRRGGYIDSDRCRDALQALEASLLEYQIPVKDVTEVYETEEGSMTPVVGGNGDVESPGGSVVCSLPVGICEKLNCGRKLSPAEMIKVIFAARSDGDRFVGSKLFDCFAGPWDSLLSSLRDDAVLREVIKRGVASDAFSIVDKLRGRFSLELCSVLAKSHVFRKTFMRVFVKLPSVDKVMSAIRKGKFDGIAQTDQFIDRVKSLKELIDVVLLNAERSNVYLPTYITNAQRALPLRGADVLGYANDSVTSMPSSWKKGLGVSSPSISSRSTSKSVGSASWNGVTGF